MNENESPFALHGRRLENDLGEYVPAYDCIILHRPYDRLISAITSAEISHRWISLHTNIGNLSFLTELLTTFLFWTYPTKSIRRRAHIDWTRHKLLLENLYHSYEIMDECFSACATQRGMDIYPSPADADDRVFKDFEESLRQYSAQVFQNYIRVKRIRKLTEEKRPELWASIFVDAAAIDSAYNPIDCIHSCDARFEFLLTTTERALEKDIALEEVRNYYMNCASRVGYRMSHPLFVEESDLTWILSRLEFLLVRDGHEPFNLEVSKEFGELLSAIFYMRQADWQGWTRYSFLGNVKNPSDFYLPSVVLSYNNGLWHLEFKGHDESRERVWGLLSLLTIVRNGILKGDQVCPLNLIEGNGDPPRLCFPMEDNRCLFRELTVENQEPRISPRTYYEALLKIQKSLEKSAHTPVSQRTTQHL